MLNKNIANIRFFFPEIYSVMFFRFRLFFNFLNYIRLYRHYFSKIVINNYILELHVNDKVVINLLYFLKNHTLTQLKTLVDIIVIDIPKNSKRFTIVYNLLSSFYNIRLQVVLQVKELMPVYSLCSLYSGANWLERECWDMFGVFFFNHPDLRRILTDYGFKGFPLRKDFPLTGYKEVYYDDIRKSIVQVPVSLAQEFRNYFFRKLWVK